MEEKLATDQKRLSNEFLLEFLSATNNDERCKALIKESYRLWPNRDGNLYDGADHPYCVWENNATTAVSREENAKICLQHAKYADSNCPFADGGVLYDFVTTSVLLWEPEKARIKEVYESL